MKTLHFIVPIVVVSFLGTVAAVSRNVLRADEPIRKGSLQLAPDVRVRCLATLRKAIKADEFWPAMHAAEALSVAGAGDEVAVGLRERLPREQNDQRRCGLARELVRAGDRSHLQVLFEILSNLQSTGRVHAAESLYKLGETGDGKELRAAFDAAENPQLRLMAAAALAKAGDAHALSFLRSQLGSQDRLVRNTVTFALARLGGPAEIDPLLAALPRETDAASRAMLAAALASLGNARGREELSRNLDLADAAVLTTSAECVGHIRAFECQGKLIRLLENSPGNVSTLDVQVRAAQALLAMSLPATPPPATKR